MSTASLASRRNLHCSHLRRHPLSKQMSCAATQDWRRGAATPGLHLPLHAPAICGGTVVGAGGCHPHKWLLVGIPRLTCARSGSALPQNVRTSARKDPADLCRQSAPPAMSAFPTRSIYCSLPALRSWAGLAMRMQVSEVAWSPFILVECVCACAGLTTRWHLTRMWTTCKCSAKMTSCLWRCRADHLCCCMGLMCTSATRTHQGRAGTHTACMSLKERPATLMHPTTGGNPSCLMLFPLKLTAFCANFWHLGVTCQEASYCDQVPEVFHK